MLKRFQNRSIRLVVLVTSVVLLLALLGIGVLYAQSSYRLMSSRVSSGAGQHSSDNYRLHGHLGNNTSACQLQSPNFTISSTDSALCVQSTSTAQTPTLTPTKVLTVTSTPSQKTPIPTSTPSASPTISISPTPNGIGDSFENDDQCSQAHSVVVDGSIQAHTFHRQSDTDWVRFDASTGTTYLVEGRVPSDSEVDLVAELYNSCTGGAQQAQNHAFSSDIRIEFTVTVNSTIYLRLLNDDTEEYGNEQKYQLSVRALSTTSAPGALIIAAGRIKNNDPLQLNIHSLTNRAWLIWHSHDYPSERIRYLATDLTLDADKDGTSDVYALANRANLKAAITEWAKDKVSAERPLTIYLMDHGNPDLFYLDKQRNELLRPQELDGWLDTLETAVPGVKITVIIEACYSGSFIQKESSISGPNRVIITSTDASTLAWASKQGAFFSDSLFDSLAQGRTLYAAFQEANAAAHQHNPNQRAWLDDNGDGLSNQNDGLIAGQRSLAKAGGLDVEQWPPYILQAEVRDIGSDRYEIWVNALDDEGVQAVWAEVYPPSYQPPESSEELVAGPVPISLQARGGDWFAAIYGQFEEMGAYRIVIYGEDELGLRSRPREIRVMTSHQVYLPLIVR